MSDKDVDIAKSLDYVLVGLCSIVILPLYIIGLIGWAIYKILPKEDKG